jgi:hypothetical protein
VNFLSGGPDGSIRDSVNLRPASASTHHYEPVLLNCSAADWKPGNSEGNGLYIEVVGIGTVDGIHGPRPSMRTPFLASMGMASPAPSASTAPGATSSTAAR